MFQRRLRLLSNGRVLDYELIKEISFEENKITIIQHDGQAEEMLNVTEDITKLSRSIVKQFNRYLLKQKRGKYNG